VIASAPRISRKLLEKIERLAREPLPFAEINRLVGTRAEELGRPRPSYQQVRKLVHEFRAERDVPTVTSIALDVTFRARPYRDLVDAVVPHYD
jgi:hypothetical protein